MTEKIPQFDFSKKDDQEKFETSSQEVKDAVVLQSQKEAEFVNCFIERGEAKDYVEAQKLINEIIESKSYKIRSALLHGKFDEAIEIKDNLPTPISSKILVSYEVTEAVDILLNSALLRDNNVDKALKIKKNFPVHPGTLEMLESPEVEEVVIGNFIYTLVEGKNDKAIEIKDTFSISPEKIEQAVFKELHYLFCITFDIDKAVKFKENLPVPVSPEKLEQAVFEGLKSTLSRGKIYDAIKIKENFFISPEKLEQAVFEGLISAFSEYDITINCALEIKNIFPISSEKLEQVVFEGLQSALSRGKNDKAVEIKDKFPISPEKIEQAVLNTIKKKLLRGYEIGSAIDDILKTKRRFNISISLEKLASPEVEQVIFTELRRVLSGGKIDRALTIKENFSISPEKLASPELDETALEALKSTLSGVKIDDAIKIIENFSISPEKLASSEVKQLALVALKNNLTNGYAIDAIQIAEAFNIPEDDLMSPEIKQAAFEGLCDCVSGDWETEVYIIRDNFFISQEKLKSDEMAKAILSGINSRLEKDSDNYVGVVKDYLALAGYNNLIDVAPDLHNKAQNIAMSAREIENIDLSKVASFGTAFEHSLSLQIFVHQHDEQEIVETIKNNPFLLDAIANNESFGLRLFTAYEEFDETSKEKIGTLFQFEEEILVQNPDMKKDSAEFRLAMQEKLKSYAKNPEIIEELRKEGIDVEAWLDHNEKEEFVLGGESLEEISILQFIERPFNRIVGETIPEYIKIVEDEIAPYAKELKEIRLPDTKTEELQEKLAKMKEVLLTTDDERKKAGIEKGIAGLEKSLANPKTVSYMDKISGSIFGLKNMLEITSQKKEEIKQCEQEKKYKKINELKKSLYLDYKTLCVRFESFQKDLQECMDKYFGEHGKAITQSVHHQTAEMLSHFATDNHDLQNVFENADFDEQIKKTKAVSLELWNRNPDVDLYLGNYSPCCISIEGGAGWDSSESAIADYMTDVSIQVLNLTDKEKNIPIMSAWLYLGKNLQGETAIIIDNIESDASQTDLHHSEIWKRVKKYVVDYAEKIGVEKVSMGLNNNDIEPSNAEYKDEEYKKIGPTNGNRADGYYLESEEEEGYLYLIWEK